MMEEKRSILHNVGDETWAPRNNHITTLDRGVAGRATRAGAEWAARIWAVAGVVHKAAPIIEMISQPCMEFLCPAYMDEWEEATGRKKFSLLD